MVVISMVTVRFEGAVAVVIGPIRMAAIGRGAIASVTMGIRRAVMTATGKAATQRQQHEQHGHGQGDEAHLKPPLIHSDLGDATTPPCSPLGRIRVFLWRAHAQRRT